MLLNLQPHSVIAVGVVLPTIASAAVALRFFTRCKLGIPLREDDWIIFVSTILVWGLGITNIAGRLFSLPGCLQATQISSNLKLKRHCAWVLRGSFESSWS